MACSWGQACEVEGGSVSRLGNTMIHVGICCDRYHIYIGVPQVTMSKLCAQKLEHIQHHQGYHRGFLSDVSPSPLLCHTTGQSLRTENLWLSHSHTISPPANFWFILWVGLNVSTLKEPRISAVVLFHCSICTSFHDSHSCYFTQMAF